LDIYIKLDYTCDPCKGMVGKIVSSEVASIRQYSPFKNLSEMQAPCLLCQWKIFFFHKLKIY